jgi:hypothetical protein
MSDGSEFANGSSNRPAIDHAGDIHDQVLALGKDTAAAYLDVYQKTAARIGGLRDNLGMASGSSAGDATPGRQSGLPINGVGDRPSKARERALEVSEMLQEASKKVTLSFLNAFELATLALADRDE